MRVTLGMSMFVAVLAGCGSEPAEKCVGGKCDDVGEEVFSACAGSLSDASKRDASKGDGEKEDKEEKEKKGQAILKRLGDPLAQVALHAEECPTTFSEMVTTLVNDPEKRCTNLQTMFVSETAQAFDEPTNYRTVTTLDCDSDEGQERIMFSLFGVDLDNNLPNRTEIIAFDAEAGVFNYYETNGQTIEFFGDSKDMLKGADGDHIRRCAKCHTGGGAVMKELKIPWMHWEGETTTPGTAELMAKHGAVFGKHSDGRKLEGIIEQDNVAWNKTRINHRVKQGNVRDLLEPLFCDVEVNVSNQGTLVGSPTFPVTDMASFDNGMLSFELDTGFIRFDTDQYTAVIRANGQHVPGLPEDFIETAFGLAHVTRGEADRDYSNQLVEQELISPEFKRSVQMVDFTREVFSTDRCGLLRYARELSREDISPEGITDGFIAELQKDDNRSAAAQELLDNLTKGTVDGAVQTFVRACKQRGEETVDIEFEDGNQTRTATVPALLPDYIEVMSRNRDLGRALEVFETRINPSALPDDKLSPPPGVRLHPVHCTRTTEFHPVH